MLRTYQFGTIIVLSMFVYVDVALAGLIRNGGRGSLTAQTENPYYFVENKDLIEYRTTSNGTDFDVFTGMSVSAFNNRGRNSNTIGGGSPGITAVPTNGPSPDTNCNGSYDQSEVDSIQDDIDFFGGSTGPFNEEELIKAENRLNDLENGSPCAWEITEGEDFTAFGQFNVFFDNPLVDTSILWNISGNGVNKTLAGSVNTDPNRTTPDGEIRFGNVVLDALWENLNLLPGEYNLSVSASISSNAGTFFSERKNLGNEGTQFSDPTQLRFRSEFNEAYFDWEQRKYEAEQAGEAFNEPEPPRYFEGYVVEDDSRRVVEPSSSLFFSSTTSLLQGFSAETLIVKARENQDPIAVSAPASGVFIMVGAYMILLRQRFIK
ncbi:hypothetical protein [Brumicola nitratireducens]|uniref:Uncharacterized protein n=1 Tax=Glaciecola nitratireducens (strain JCM 12485 / KCTC 12276 / FR1064) TaxID=1085623 RepID=G4QIT4_GLANF|nr:hypothetical protein [Glaciecola nitratireducens]AEP28273.1 hypothetical protein GNIT_0119 [Glaciecola nitratireducens FR1064]